MVRNSCTFFIFIAILLTSCSSDSAWDCVKTTGNIHQEEVALDSFSKIEVFHRVQLFVQQGDSQKVVLETGENLRNAITLDVSDNKLTIKNENSCNLFRDYGVTKVYVTSPNITELRNSSGLTVKSIGVLNYESLDLRSDDTSSSTVTHTNGDYDLELQVENFTIVANGNANYFLKGSATNANVGLYSGDARFEAADFEVQHFQFFHRSSNKMLVNPRQSLTGEIRSTGDVISVYQPPVVAVETFYTGRLIFQ
ncbi:MAG TPA: head GIN domain-containing protein [Flavobacteriaceae bacterium]|nr:head GIN domain-containing protein [Flavobacteriaceae bacterium]